MCHPGGTGRSRAASAFARTGFLGFPKPADPASVRGNQPGGQIMSIEDKLAALGVILPDAPAPQANYVPFVQAGDLVFVSGQISADENGLITGRLGADMDVEAGAAAARTCAIALLAQVKAACDGDLSRLVRVVRLGGFVNSTSDFDQQPAVINGASDFMVAVLGDAGRHARTAVGTSTLPLGVAVEIDGVFQIR